MGLILSNEGRDIEEFVVIRGRNNRSRLLTRSGEEDELLGALGPVLTQEKESDGNEEESSDLKERGRSEQIATDRGFHVWIGMQRSMLRFSRTAPPPLGRRR